MDRREFWKRGLNPITMLVESNRSSAARARSNNVTWDDKPAPNKARKYEIS